MIQELRGATALITGASRGIGAFLATRLAAEGMHLALAARKATRLEAVRAACEARGVTVRVVVADVSVAADRERLVHEAGDIDVLINNAAISDDTPIEELGEEHWRHVLSINLDSALHVAKAALPHLKQSPSGSIVNIASVQGIRGQPHSMAYATAKGGLVNLTRCMAVDFGPFGIRANAVAPGYIDTALTERFLKNPLVSKALLDKTPLRRFGTAEEIARAALFFASADSAYVTGAELAVDGGMTAGL